jgi:hypothetical protein
MASNENNDQVNEAIKDLLRRGHPFRGKKMNAPQGEPGLPHRPRKEDAPPKYGKADEAGAPPSYDTKERPSVSEKRSTDEEPSVAEKAVAEEPVAPPKIRPILFIRPKKTGPTAVCTHKIIANYLSKQLLIRSQRHKYLRPSTRR